MGVDVNGRAQPPRSQASSKSVHPRMSSWMGMHSMPGFNQAHRSSLRFLAPEDVMLTGGGMQAGTHGPAHEEGAPIVNGIVTARCPPPSGAPQPFSSTSCQNPTPCPVRHLAFAHDDLPLPTCSQARTCALLCHLPMVPVRAHSAGSVALISEQLVGAQAPWRR